MPGLVVAANHYQLNFVFFSCVFHIKSPNDLWNLKILTQEVVNVTNALGQISQYPAPLGLIMASRNGLMLDSGRG